MGVIINDNKLVTITEPKTIHFDLPKKIDSSLKHETDFLVKHNEFLAEDTIKNEISQYCPNISMGMIFMITENSKTNDSHKSILNLLQRLDLTSLKRVALQNLPVYNT